MSRNVPNFIHRIPNQNQPKLASPPPYVDDPLLLPKYISRYQRPERLAILPGSQSREMEIPPMQTVVHVTHEAIHKIGGIGAVLHGLFTSRIFLDQISRYILVGPFWPTDAGGETRLGSDGEALY